MPHAILAICPATTLPEKLRAHAGETVADERILSLNEENFDEEIQRRQGPILVDFWADWCQPCKVIGPSLEQLAEELSGRAWIAKVNVDENPELAAKYGIRSIPTLILLKDGENKQQFVGLQQQAALVSAIDAEQ